MDYEEFSNSNVITSDSQLEMSAAFPVLMRKVYLWMSLALAITGFTAYYVATSEAILTAISVFITTWVQTGFLSILFVS